MKKWVKDICNETYEFWKKNKDHYSNSHKGFAIFYSPVKINPKLMMIGLNPGWTKNDTFNEVIACDLPEKHDYFAFEKDDKNDYDLAKIMRDFFEHMDLTEVLKASVKLNLIFFRTSDEEELKRSEIYNEMKAVSENKIKLIVEKIQPEIILTEGIGVFDELMSMFGESDQKTHIKDSKGQRILTSGKLGNSLILGMIHPSGRFTKNQFQIYRNEISKEVKSLVTV